MRPATKAQKEKGARPRSTFKRPGVPLSLRAGLVLTAGICEEFIYRGFAIEELGALAGSRWLAALISLIFSLCRTPGCTAFLRHSFSPLLWAPRLRTLSLAPRSSSLHVNARDRGWDLPDSCPDVSLILPNHFQERENRVNVHGNVVHRGQRGSEFDGHFAVAIKPAFSPRTVACRFNVE